MKLTTAMVVNEPRYKDILLPCIEKYGLEFEHSDRRIRLNLEGVTLIYFLLDYNFVDMYFVNPNDKSGADYDPIHYITVVFGRLNNPLSNLPPGKDLAETHLKYLKVYNELMIKYFEDIFKGDFSWVDSYVKRKEQFDLLLQFLLSHKFSAKRSIIEKWKKGDASWEDEALRWYRKTNR